MILADRILDTLRANGPIAAGEFPRWFGGIDRIDLDAEVSRLLRKNSISFAFNKYDLVAQKANGHVPFVSQVGMETPPSAAEEVAASLKPATALCIDCGPQPVNEFRRSSRGKPHKRCYKCAGLVISNAMSAKHKQSLAGGRAITTAEDSTLVRLESSGPDRLPPDTPASPKGSTEPPATSSAGSPDTGPTQTAEALSPVGAVEPVFAAISERFNALVEQMNGRYDAYEKAADAVHEFADALHQLDRQVREELGLEEGG